MPFLGKEMSPNIDHKSWEFQGTKTTPPAWKEGLTRAVFTITSLGALFPGGEHSRGYPSIPMNKGVATQVIHNPWGFFSLRTPPTIPGTMESGLFVGGMKSNQIICQVGLPKNKKESRFWKKKNEQKKNIHLNLAERNFLNIDLKTSWCIRWVDQHLFDPGRPQLVGLEPFKHLELWVVLEGGSDWNLEILEKEICLYNWHAGMYDFLTENHHSPFFLGNFRCFRKMLTANHLTGHVKIFHSQQVHCYKSPPVWTKGCITSELIPGHETFCNLQFLGVGHSAPNSAITQI